jgi:hypothetical protein
MRPEVDPDLAPSHREVRVVSGLLSDRCDRVDEVDGLNEVLEPVRLAQMAPVSIFQPST